jgi:diacylglycerol kinase (ATP)
MEKNKRVHIIVNPVSGNGQAAVAARELMEALQALGCECQLTETKERGDAEQAAQEQDFDVIVSVGGDGTTSEIVNGLNGKQTPLAIFPMGTANVLAGALELPNDPEAVAEMIVKGKTQALDCGLHAGRRFIMGAGAGLDGQLVETIHSGRQGTMGHSGWIGPALQGIAGYEFPYIRVSVDGNMICEDAHCVLVRNCGSLAGIFPVMPEARCDDGVFDVLVIRDLTVGKLFELAAMAFTPNFHEREDIIYTKGTLIEAESPEGMDVPVQRDGDPAGLLPARWEADVSAVRLVVP